MRCGVVAGGNWIVDRVKFVDTYPAQDALANILGEEISNGGSAYNVLLDLAKLGAPFPLEAIGLVGRDADGERVMQDCASHGIDTGLLRVTDRAPTSYTDVMTVRSTGRRTFFHQRGANALLDCACFPFESTRARHLHLGYILLLDSLDEPDDEYGTRAARVLAAAREAGLSTSIDLVSEDGARFGPLVPPALRHTDVCFMNEFEAERTSGVPLGNPDERKGPRLHEAAEKILGHGSRVLVIHAPEAAYAWSSDGFSSLGAVCLPEGLVASVVGAGDAFAAGFLLGWHEGQSVEQCLRFGVCAAASCVQAAGCSSGVLPLGECLALGDRYGFRQH